MLRKIRYIMILMFLLFICNYKVKAICDYSEIAKMKSLVSNVNVSYDYTIVDNFAYFSVTLTNIVPEIYFQDLFDNKIYTYYDTLDGEITINNYFIKKGTYRFYSTNSNCYGMSLGNKYYKFPTYNINYNTDLCKSNSTYNLCKKWVDKNYSYADLEDRIRKYNELKEEKVEDIVDVTYNKTVLDIIVAFYVKYYYIILIAIILICTVIMIINRKKNSFKL